MRALLQPLGWIVAMLIVALTCSALKDAVTAAGRPAAGEIAAVLSGVAALLQATFAGVALLSLRYANETLKHQQAISEAELRPYFGVDKCEIVKIEEGGPLLMMLRFKNFGATPVLAGTLRYTLGFSSARSVPIPLEEALSECESVRLPPIPPGDDFNLNLGWTDETALTDQVLAGVGHAVVTFDISYSDAFAAERRTVGQLHAIGEGRAFNCWRDGFDTMT